MKQIKTICKRYIVIMLVLSMMGCASSEETVGNYLDDTVITTKVKAALIGEKGLNSSQIKVETFKGQVQLTGFVSSAQDVQKAVALTRNTKGVKRVINNMIVK